MQAEIAARPDVREVTDAAQAIVSIAGSYTVTSPEQYVAAGADLTRIAGAQKKLEAVRQAITRPMDAAKKAVLDFFRDPEAKLETAKNTIKRAMIAYDEQQRRIREEEQRKADERARKERERLEAQAQKAVDSGKIEKAEQLQTRAAAVVAPIISTAPPKVAGVSMREVWKFEVTDASAVPREYCSVDEMKIRKVVQALKGDAKIPGVRIYPDKQIAAGAA